MMNKYVYWFIRQFKPGIQRKLLFIYVCGYLSSSAKKKILLGILVSLCLLICLLVVLYPVHPLSYRIKLAFMPTYYSRSQDKFMRSYVHTSSAAQLLPKEGQLFCFVQRGTKPFDPERATLIAETWLKKCDHGQLFTSQHIDAPSDVPYSTVLAGIPDTERNMFYMSNFALYYIWNFISKDFKWYMKTQDSTYAVTHNLKAYLETLDHNKPYYIGYTVKKNLKHGYNSGAAGYVLSQEAMRMYNEKLFNNTVLCPDHQFEDVGIGQCLASIGIYPHDTSNNDGKNRFNPLHYMDMIEDKDDMGNKKVSKDYEAFASDLITLHGLTYRELQIFHISLNYID